jgi:SpoVK/Ycf46/Vps4 family AAA+-type ATPase
LSFEADPARFADVGGLKNLRRGIQQRRAAFDGSAPGLDAPKGVLLLGVQGCGKSVAARAAAGIYGVPLLRLDFGAIHNKYIGESERNLRETLATAEVMQPCVLWIDEIEKGLAAGSSDSDGGVSRRVLGYLLTWMAERRSRVFVVATANQVHELPAELLRKGRFDEIFFVDLPDRTERLAILRIHLGLRKQDPARFDLEYLADAMEGWSGAEIEQAVTAALYGALHKKRALDTTQLLQEIGGTVPLSVSRREDVERLRALARERFVPVR